MRLWLAVGVICALAAPALTGHGRAVARPALTITYHAGWNLVGAPGGTRYAGADGAIYTLQPGDDGYEVLPAGTPAQTAQGYWVYFPGARTLALPQGDAGAAVPLPPGHWIMIGNPSGSATLPVAGADALYTYDPVRGYHAAASLAPGQGAWAISLGGGTLVIGTPPEPAAVVATRSR